MSTHKIIKQGTMETAVAYIDGEMYVISDSDPHFASVVEQLDNGVYKPELFDVFKALEHSYKRLGERFAVKGRTILFDNDPIENEHSQTLLRYLDAGEDTDPFVNFLEKLANNPEPHSREQAVAWMGRNEFQIAPDGDVWCYKGMYRKDDGYIPGWNGKVLINGEESGGEQKAQQNGDIVEMPRSKTSHDPNSPCATGLHVANWRFAHSYATATVLVKINPRDIVNVPHSDAEKMRVCRYVVCGEVTEPVTGLVLAAPDYVTEDEPITWKEESVELVSTEPITSDGALEDEDDASPIEPKGIVAKVKRKIVTHGIDWTDKRIAKLMKCSTNKQFEKAFPGANVETLKRRKREFARKGY